MKRRSNPALSGNSSGQRRKKHLLPGLIKCGACGASYVINGKDYYRCAGTREGKCRSDISIRKSVIEDATLSVIQNRLMTAELAELFAIEFERQVKRLRATDDDQVGRVKTRLAELNIEIGNLASNFVKGVVSPTLAPMLADREAEKEKLTQRLRNIEAARKADILPHPALLERYAARVQMVREALSDPSVRQEASEALRSLIATITVYEDTERTYADVVGDPAKIIDFVNNGKRQPVGAPSSILIL